MSQVLGMDGKPKQPVGPTYHMRLCLVGSDDVDIKNVQTFGIAEDGLLNFYKFFYHKTYL